MKTLATRPWLFARRGSRRSLGQGALLAACAARERRISSKEAPMSIQIERRRTFAVSGGIFGVGSLATRLNALVTSGQIGEWHIGHWTDWRHTAIRINCTTAADAALAEATCAEA
jgi:hypothetical protein